MPYMYFDLILFLILFRLFPSCIYTKSVMS